MQEHILERYSRTENGEFIIDLAAHRMEDLFDFYDRTSSFLKKDLDGQLVDFIVDSAREVGAAPFVIRVSLAVPVAPDQKQRLQASIREYFLYLKDLQRRQIRGRIRSSMVLLLAGLCILTLTVFINKIQGIHDSVIGSVFAEGLTIAAWVSLWEALATFLINWPPLRANVRLYERIATTPVYFH